MGACSPTCSFATLWQIPVNPSSSFLLPLLYVSVRALMLITVFHCGLIFIFLPFSTLPTYFGAPSLATLSPSLPLPLNFLYVLLFWNFCSCCYVLLPWKKLGLATVQ
ncbi:hypothetical protein L208DRAFT_183644 [Tricholoma matsutake]|nr:hypothetical protein L208DRAFT_183644 [Tricholoma matsutake 945]